MYEKCPGLTWMILIAASCTFAATVNKTPSSISNKTIEANFRTLVVCENINLEGTQAKTDGQASSELEIKVINGTNLPSNETDLKTLGKNWNAV